MYIWEIEFNRELYNLEWLQKGDPSFDELTHYQLLIAPNCKSYNEICRIKGFKHHNWSIMELGLAH